MPSTVLLVQSGGIGLVGSAIYSGTPWPIGGVQILLDDQAPGPIYIGLPNQSGEVTTFLSGTSLSATGLSDGMRILAGKDYFIPKYRLVSGIETIRIVAPAASSGARIFWEPM